MIPAAQVLIGEEEIQAVEQVLRSGMIAGGAQVAAFEDEFAHKLTQGRRCVAVNSGTSGLLLGLLAAGVGRGDEVIVPSFTFAATANSVALTGATPIFADIEPAHYTLDPQAIEAAIGPRTRGIMPVHMYGHSANMDEIVRIAQKHKLEIYEDAAQAHGSAWRGKQVGTWGTFGMFSLYPTKNMTSGEGGMVSCQDGQIERTIKLLRNQGMEKRYENEIVGYNARMTDIHAAIGREQLKKLDTWTMQRQRNATWLNENLHGVQTPTIDENATHVWHQYTIRIADRDRDAFAAELQKRGIGCGVYYPIPNHKLPSLSTWARSDLEQTDKAAREVLSLPVHPGLKQEDLEKIAEIVNEVARAGR